MLFTVGDVLIVINVIDVIDVIVVLHSYLYY